MSTKLSLPPVRFCSSAFSLSISAPLRPMMIPGRAVLMMMRRLLRCRSISMVLTPADLSFLSGHAVHVPVFLRFFHDHCLYLRDVPHVMVELGHERHCNPLHVRAVIRNRLLDVGLVYVDRPSVCTGELIANQRDARDQ